MDNQFQNDSGFIDRHQSRSRAADMPQLTSFGLECMDSWADCFDNMKVGNASDLTMQPFEFPQAGIHGVDPPLAPVSNPLSPYSMIPTYMRRPMPPHAFFNLPTGDLKNYDSTDLQRDPVAFQTVHDSTTGQTCESHERHSDCHKETRNQHWHEASPLRCQWKDCSSNDTFSNEGSLVRHIKAKHISPEKYRCPCRKSFGRKDRFRDHMRLKHPELGHAICKKCHEC